MTENENAHYKCVNCGEPATALFKTYGPSVLKLTKCNRCKEIVDKYIEYDPVIVMIDLVLMSKEAQRHVLYNTEFKSYWKLLIILIMLETYGVWRNESLFNIAIDTMCSTHSNTTINSTIINLPINISVWEPWKDSWTCQMWAQEQTGDDTDLFIWEKDFYIKFISIFAGIAVFILTVHCSMLLLRPITSQNKVSVAQLVKAFSLADAHVLLSLPTLVWGRGAEAPTRAAHLALAFLYNGAAAGGVLGVLYECPMVVTILVLSVSNITKYTTSFYITPYLRTFVT